MKTNVNAKPIHAFIIAAWLLSTSASYAHCDTMDGPVIADAKVALAKGDITPALKWIKQEHTEALKTTFTRTVTVRKLGTEARDLADMYFFETLVRLHREGEGAPYTGLKPSGAKVDPTIEAADKALDSGNADALVRSVTDETAAGIRKRFNETVEKKKHADHNVEAGREYVAAYVEFVHYVEALHTTAVPDAHRLHESDGLAKSAHSH